MLAYSMLNVGLIALISALLLSTYVVGSGYYGFLPHAVYLYPSSEAEANEVIRATIDRTRDQEALFTQSDSSVAHAFTDLVDEPVSQVQEVAGTISPLILLLKYLLNRPRPAQVSAGLAATGLESTTADTPAFPSGHTAQAYAVALHYARIYPSKRDRLLERADAIGKSRVAAGLHYPSDHAASRDIAHFIFWT